MRRIPWSFFCLGVAIVLASTGCKPQQPGTPRSSSPPPAPAPTVSAAAGGASATVADQQAAGTKPAGSNFDRTAFAGTFTGTLPCADCPGIDETLLLDATGHFELTDVYRARPDSTHVVRGTWTVQAGGALRVLRLDPEKPRDVERAFAIDGNDSLAPLGMDGERIDSPVDLTLKRSTP